MAIINFLKPEILKFLLTFFLKFFDFSQIFRDMINILLNFLNTEVLTTLSSIILYTFVQECVSIFQHMWAITKKSIMFRWYLTLLNVSYIWICDVLFLGNTQVCKDESQLIFPILLRTEFNNLICLINGTVILRSIASKMWKELYCNQ